MTEDGGRTTDERRTASNQLPATHSRVTHHESLHPLDNMQVNRKPTQDNSLESQIEEAHQRLEALIQRTAGIPETAQHLFEEALESLSISLEELEVMAEELHQQNDELVATRLELDTERRRYQEFFELAPGGYLVTDPAGIIQEANQRAAVLLNVADHLLVG